MNQLQSFTLPLALFAFFSSSANAQWQELDRRDMYRVVLINQASVNNKSVYWDALRKVCANRFCNVVFISDVNDLIRDKKDRLSDDEVNKISLIYSTNGGFKWNCRLHPDADRCFKF